MLVSFLWDSCSKLKWGPLFFCSQCDPDICMTNLHVEIQFMSLTDFKHINLHKFVYHGVSSFCVFWQTLSASIFINLCISVQIIECVLIDSGRQQEVQLSDFDVVDIHIISFTWYNATGKLYPLHLYLMEEINIHNKSFSACAMCTDLCYANHGYQGQAETEIKVLQGAPSFLKIIKHGNTLISVSAWPWYPWLA